MGADRARPVWNAAERRPRALVRIAVYTSLVAGALNGAAFLVPRSDDPLGWLVRFYLLQTIFVVVVTAIAARVLDRRPFGALGLRPRRGYAGDLLFGALAGGLCIALVAIIEDSCGWATYQPRVAGIDSVVGVVGPAARVLVLFACGATVEEITFRGYAITNLAEGIGGSPRRRAWGALVLSSIAFGIAHAANPSASWVPVAYIAFGGIFLGFAYLVRGDLALPIGLHLGWNYAQSLLGMPVSGLDVFDAAALVRRTETGPDVATGGPFGPEAGLLGLFAMAVGIALAAGWARARSGRVRVDSRFGPAGIPARG